MLASMFSVITHLCQVLKITNTIMYYMQLLKKLYTSPNVAEKLIPITNAYTNMTEMSDFIK